MRAGLAIAIKANPAPARQRFFAERDTKPALHELAGRFDQELDDLRHRQLERKTRVDHVVSLRMGASPRNEALHRDVERDNAPVFADEDARGRTGVKQCDTGLPAAGLGKRRMPFVRPFCGRGSQRRSGARGW